MPKRYQSPYDPNDPMNGMPVTVISSHLIKRLDGGADDRLLVLELPSGNTVTAWESEVIDDPAT